MSEQGSPRAPGRGRVLVVDDDDALLRASQRLLAADGWEVETASTAEQAVARLGDAFDCVVSDIHLPGMDGVQLLRRVRDHDLDLPVVLVTGDPSLDSAIRAVEYGAFRYLTKPVPPKDLLAAVRAASRLFALARVKRELFLATGEDARLVGDRAGLEATFERALDSLWMAFQPIVHARDRRIYAFEALMRSVEPALPHPGAVLEAAERLGRVHALGRAVRRKIAEAVPAAEPDALFFVNLHPLDLLDETLWTQDALLPHAARIVLEITERSSLDGVKDVRARVAKLRAAGYRLAVDDLGAGYAGLSSFASIEPEVVKLDMSVVRGIESSPVKRRVAARMTDLAHDLGILVVAEGIETPAERDVLVEIGCDLLQGYLLAKPGRPFPTVSG